MSTGLPEVNVIDDCWNRIGIGGDRTCPELAVHIHCRSCPVFSAAARRVVMGSRTARWAFPAEEVLGVQRIARADLRTVSSTFTKAAKGYSQSVFSCNDRTVGLLDEKRILEALGSLRP